MRKNLDVLSLIYSKPLEAFFAVCQQRSFTKAAEVLGLTQSAVSQNIHRLEQSLGVNLFERNVRPIELTPEAKVLKEQLEAHAAEVTGSIARLREDNSLKPIIRAAVVESLSPNIAPSLVRALAQQSNRISILTGTSDIILEGLLQRQVDVLIASAPFSDVPGLSRYFLFEEPHVLILPKTLAERKETWTWHDLQFCGLPIIRYFGQTASGNTIEAFFRSMRFEFPARFEADSSRVLFSLVADGVGWGLTTPLCLLQCADMLPQIQIARAPDPIFSREIYVICRAGEGQRLAESVLQICTAELEKSIVPALVRIAPEAAAASKIAVANSLERRAAWMPER